MIKYFGHRRNYNYYYLFIFCRKTMTMNIEYTYTVQFEVIAKGRLNLDGQCRTESNLVF